MYGMVIDIGSKVYAVSSPPPGYKYLLNKENLCINFILRVDISLCLKGIMVD